MKNPYLYESGILLPDESGLRMTDDTFFSRLNVEQYDVNIAPLFFLQLLFPFAL